MTDRSRPPYALVLCAGLLLGLVFFWGTFRWVSRPSPARPLAANIDLTAPTLRLRVLGKIPHDKTAFTEGLSWVDGTLVESTGPVRDLPTPAVSRIQVLDPTSGKIIRSTPIPPGYFGEGVAATSSGLASLTWTGGRGFLWSWPDLDPTGTFSFPGEGWGLASAGHVLWMSDGTPVLRRWSSSTLKPIDTLTVTDAGRPVPNLNELEWANGWILANVWRTGRILVIDPKSGIVHAQLDLSSLLPPPSELRDPREDVANGVAFDPKEGTLYITGKEWPWIIRVAWPVGLEVK